MGMFDQVRFRAACHKCHEPIEYPDWQTKDGNPYMNDVEVREVRNFYAICKACKAWNEYDVAVDQYHLVPAHDRNP